MKKIEKIIALVDKFSKLATKPHPGHKGLRHPLHKELEDIFSLPKKELANRLISSYIECYGPIDPDQEGQLSQILFQNIKNLESTAQEDISQKPQTAQSLGVADLFFGEGYSLSKFVDSLGTIKQVDSKVAGTKSVAKLMVDFWNKTNESCSLKIDISAEAGRDASLNIEVTPATLKPAILKELDSQSKKLDDGLSLQQRLLDAKKKAKSISQIEGDTSKTIVDMGI